MHEISINCPEFSGLLELEQSKTFQFLVKDDAGNPCVNQKLKCFLTKAKSIELSDDELQTDEEGTAKLTLTASDTTENAVLYVKKDKSEWSDQIYVTDVDIETSADVEVDDLQENLLKMLYWDKKRINVLRELGGGLSGNRVLQIESYGQRGVDLTQVVKIGSKDEMSGEQKNYKDYFHDRVTWAAPITGYAELGRFAAIIYGDASESSALKPVTSFAHYFEKHQSHDVLPALHAILENGLNKVYRYYEVDRTQLLHIVEKYLPENLMVSLKRGKGVHGVYFTKDMPTLTNDVVTLSPKDIEKMDFSVKPGDTVFLQNFTISKMQKNDLNLEDPKKEKYKIKVFYDGAEVSHMNTGDRVNVVAQVIADRNDRMKFAVSHCLATFGFSSYNSHYRFDGEQFPDPTILLPDVLNSSMDYAQSPIHGDLHWENLMLERPENWWLIDYGLSTKGPVLFDFIKLELYLRSPVLVHLPDVQPQQLIQLELTLLDNSFGYLTNPDLGHPQLNKALQTIQSIRRLAKKYVIGDFSDYLKFLFAYAVALTKYYPTQDKWNQEDDHSGKEHLVKHAKQTYAALMVALAVGRVLTWEKDRQKRPLPHCEFVSMGKLLDPQEGKVALDVGSRCIQGVIDHHFGKGEEDCAASIVYKKPELFLRHVANLPAEKVTWIVHEYPDFDCITSLYLASFRKRWGFFPPGANQLQRYAAKVDAGAEFTTVVEAPELTPYALFRFQTHCEEVPSNQHETCLKMMEKGFEVLDFIICNELNGNHTLIYNRIPQDHGFWEATEKIGNDRYKFETFDENPEKQINVQIRANGEKKRVPGLIIESPRSIAFKDWARSKGYVALVVRYPAMNKPDHRIVISVPPTYKYGLKGFGAILEEAETEKRQKLGKQRPKPKSKKDIKKGTPNMRARYEDVTNNDPWYDGRSPLHAYTIVDSPREGTVLTLDEVVEMLLNKRWLRE